MVFQLGMILSQWPFTEELVNFTSITGQPVGSWMSYNRQLAQFYTNMKYEDGGTPHLSSIVNQKYAILTGDKLEEWMKLPN